MKYILKKNAKILILVGISIIIVNILSASHPLVMKGILDIDVTEKEALMRLFITYFIIHIILVLAKNARNSIINKAMDDNEKNGIPKQKNSILYEENNENSIKIEVKFSDDRANASMESIANLGTEEFVKLYPTATFKCTKIEYHQKTEQIKYMLFEYIKGWFYY